MKKIIGLLSCVLLMAGSGAYAADAAPAKFAVVNVQQVLMKSSKVTKVNTKLQDQFKPRQEKLANQQKSLQEQLEKFNKDSATMSKKDKEAAEKKIANDKANFMKDATAFQKEVTTEQNKAMQKILGELNAIIASKAKKDGYALVLDSQAVVFSNDATDVTSQVADEFNK